VPANPCGSPEEERLVLDAAQFREDVPPVMLRVDQITEVLVAITEVGSWGEVGVGLSE
jgi:hypothetical protein